MKKTIIAMLALSGVAFGASVDDLNANLESIITNAGYKAGDGYTLYFTIDSGVNGGLHTMITLTDNWTLDTQIGQYVGFNEAGGGIPGNYGDLNTETRKNPFIAEIAEDSEGWVFDNGAAGNLGGVNITLSYAGGDTTRLTLTKGGATWVDATLLTKVDLGDVSIGAAITGMSNAALTVTPALAPVVAVPEPTTATLSLLALAGLAARRRRK